MLSSRQKIVKKLPQLLRQLSTENHVFEEVKIPVPWGHITGKWWGPHDKRPILCCHGWQDNCGSFDTLVPLLPSHLGYLAIDFPGHGHSTQLPSGIFYHGIDSVIIIKRIVDYFNWSKVSLLGHSLGAITSYQYGLLYPDTMDFLICLDSLKPLVHENEKIERMVRTIQSFLKYDKLNNLKGEPPCYTFDVLEKMLHEGTRKSIALESCKYILERNVAPSTSEPGKYYFKRDGRLKVSILLGWAQKDIVESASRITYPLFVSKATQSPFFEKKEHVKEVIEVIQKVNKDFEYHSVEGTHHVHLNNPERLGSLISTFIKKYDKADRSDGGLKQS